MKGDTYQCAWCKKWFIKTRTDQEVQKEFNENFPDQDIKDGQTVCDNCYRELMNTNKKWN